MKKNISFAFHALVLSLAVQHTCVQAQPLEMVTLSDKGGLLPIENKAGKEEPPKNVAPKTMGNAKKVSAASHAEKVNTQLSSSASTRGSYVVKAGDTLDKIISMHFADSIVKPEVLRKEIVALNPGAFVKDNPKMLLSGVSLKLPQTEQLLNKSANNTGTTWSGEKANLSLSGYTSYPPVYVNAESSEKRRHWVQYP